METVNRERSAVRREFGGGIEALNTAADAVEQLLSSAGWTILMERLEVEGDEIRRKLDRPAIGPDGHRLIPTQAEFSRDHGYLDGLFSVRRNATALLDQRQRKIEEQRAIHEDAPASDDDGGQ